MSVIGSGWTESERRISYGPSKLSSDESSSVWVEADFMKPAEGSLSIGDFFFKLAGRSEKVDLFPFLTSMGLESPKRL
eukprot:1195959-Rhodomonas_salina.1